MTSPTAAGARPRSTATTTRGGFPANAPCCSDRPMKRKLDKLSRPVALPDDLHDRARLLLETEWLVTNGLGGYASGTLAGVITRRYHGILVAALPNPLGRTVMLNHLGARVHVDRAGTTETDRKSTRLNSSHGYI